MDSLSKDAVDTPVPGGDEAYLEQRIAKQVIAALSSPPAPHSAARPKREDRGRPDRRSRSDSKDPGTVPGTHRVTLQ